MFYFMRIASRSNSIALSTGVSAAVAILVVIASVISSAFQIDSIAATKQNETVKRLIQQHGYALARELKVQTLWSEGYLNSRQLNTEWMHTFYGPYLDRLLGYSRLYVLNGANEPVYSYHHGESTQPNAYSGFANSVSDLVGAMRSSLAELKSTYRIAQTDFDLGNGEHVTHRSISDIRNVGGRPAFVVVLTILPDAPQAEPIASIPFLMIAVSYIDDAFLQKLGTDFGFNGLSWQAAKDRELSSSLAIVALDGSPVGELHWTSQRPGWELATRMTPGLFLAVLLLLSLATLLVSRNFKQAGSLENYSKRLKTINASLEQIVSERTQELTATFDNIAQGIILLKDDGSVAISNTQALDLLELKSAAELPQEAVKLREEGAALAVESERRALPQQSLRRDYTRASGRIIEVRQTLLGQGGIVVTISDVSALKKRQQELEAATRAATAGSEAKSRFLSTMSHEMRTPLNGVIGALELISKTPLSHDQAQLVNIAVQSSDALLVHINDVLDFSKLEAEKLELHSKPFNLRRTIQSVVDITKSLAEHRRNEIIVDYPADIPQNIIGDSVRLRQIILNLVSNSNKFTHNGQISVRVRSEGGTAGAPLFIISVSDTGIGIPANRLDDLFQEFSMLESEYTRKSGGTGLGLAISKRLIEAMGGSIGVESIERSGSTFRIKAAFQLATDAMIGTDAVTDGSQDVQKPLDILLVDDNSTNRLIGRRLLEAAGHRITTASNGRQAVDLAAANSFDAILMDISMPEMDGREATAHIRKMPAPYSEVPIIALTANAVIGDREAFIAAGMNDYLSKPFRQADLVSKLSCVTRMARHENAQPGSVRGALERQLPILDEEALAELANETSDEVVNDVIEAYLNELTQRLNVVLEAMSSGARGDIEKVCHSIAGASHGAGAARLADLAKHIELACISADEATLERCGAEFPKLICSTQATYREYLDMRLAREAA